jgi:hypothetical protein
LGEEWHHITSTNVGRSNPQAIAVELAVVNAP